MLSSYLAGFSAQIFPALAILLGGFSLAPALDAFIYLLPTLAVGLALGHSVSRFVPGQVVHRIIFFLLYAACICSIGRELIQ